MSLRFRTRTAVALGAVGCAAGTLLAAVACIPDLPDDGPLDAADGAAEAAPDQVTPPQPKCGDRVVNLDMGEECDPGPTVGDAGANGCTADCKMICPGGAVWLKNDHCYQPVLGGAPSLDQGNTELATNKCLALGGHVVTFASEDEYEAVVGLVDGGASFWVGLNSAFFKYNGLATFEPGWATTCAGCFAHTDDASIPLPADDAGPQGCVEGFADTSRSWQQYPCTGIAQKIGVICEREPGPFPQSTRCDGGVCIDLVWTHGAKRYLYVSGGATADNADQACRAMGGSLVVLESHDEREQLWRELSRMPGFSSPPGAVWIGLSVVGADDAGDPVWAWADDAAVGDDAHPSPWGDRQPKAGTRAYIYHASQPPTPVDDTLARTAAATTAFPYVCQLLP